MSTGAKSEGAMGDGQVPKNPKDQVQTALGVFNNAKNDEERFVGLLLLTKGHPPESAEDVEAVERVVGYSFLRRLLASHTDANVGPLFPQLAASILGLYAVSDKVVRSEAFANVLPNVVLALVEFLQRPRDESQKSASTGTAGAMDTAQDSPSSEGPDAKPEEAPQQAQQQQQQQQQHQHQQGGEEDGMQVAEEHESGVQGSQGSQEELVPSDRAVFDCLQVLITGLDAGHTVQLPRDLLSQLAVWLDDAPMGNARPLISASVAFAYRAGLLLPAARRAAAVFLTHLFATLHDEFKLESGRALTSLLQSLSPGALASAPKPLPAPQASDGRREPCVNWFNSVVHTAKALLQHKLGPRERRVVLQLLSAAIAHEPFKALPLSTINECMPFIARRAAIEVRMTLEQEHLESCLEDVDLTACCFLIVESAISCLVTRGDEFNTTSAENALAGCKMTVEAVLFFTSNCSDNAWETQAPHDVLLLLAGCARILGAWFADNDTGIDQFLPTVEYLLNLVHDRSISNKKEDQQWARITFWHLLPALCTATAHTDFRHSIVGDTHCIALACRTITCHLHTAGVLAGGESSSSSSSSSSQSARDSKTAVSAARDKSSARTATDSTKKEQDDAKEDEDELAAACNLACNLLLNVLVEDPSEARESATLAQLARTIAPALASDASCTEPGFLAALVVAYIAKRNADNCASSVRDDALHAAAMKFASARPLLAPSPAATTSASQANPRSGEAASTDAVPALVRFYRQHSEAVLLLAMVSGDLGCDVDGSIGKGTFTSDGDGDGDGEDDDDPFDVSDRSVSSRQQKQTELAQKKHTARMVAAWTEALGWLALALHKYGSGGGGSGDHCGHQGVRTQQGQSGASSAKKTKKTEAKGAGEQRGRKGAVGMDADRKLAQSTDEDVLEDMKMGCLIHFERVLAKHRQWLLPRLQKRLGPSAAEVACVHMQALLSM